MAAASGPLRGGEDRVQVFPPQESVCWATRGLMLSNYLRAKECTSQQAPQLTDVGGLCTPSEKL